MSESTVADVTNSSTPGSAEPAAPYGAASLAPETPAPDVEFDPHEAAAFPPDLYQYAGIAEGVSGLGAVDEQELARYREQGYLVIHDVLTPAEVGDALDGLADLIDGARPDFRGIQFEAGARRLLPSLPRERKPDYVRKLISYVAYDARLEAVSAHPGLLALITRLLSEPPALFADQALLKPPLIGREKPWHQDHAYFNVPLGTRVVGVWIALDDATPDNGCMHVIPGSHLQGPVVHFRRRDWQLCDTDVARHQILAVPLRPGGALLFDGLLHHGTPPSTSPKRRRALQFHYVPDRAGRITSQERLAVFGSDGKDVTC
jgi:phytanoyl-CoA hydroxylase